MNIDKYITHINFIFYITMVICRYLLIQGDIITSYNGYLWLDDS